MPDPEFHRIEGRLFAEEVSLESIAREKIAVFHAEGTCGTKLTLPSLMRIPPKPCTRAIQVPAILVMCNPSCTSRL